MGTSWISREGGILEKGGGGGYDPPYQLWPNIPYCIMSQCRLTSEHTQVGKYPIHFRNFYEQI